MRHGALRGPQPRVLDDQATEVLTDEAARCGEHPFEGVDQPAGRLLLVLPRVDGIADVADEGVDGRLRHRPEGGIDALREIEQLTEGDARLEERATGVEDLEVGFGVTTVLIGTEETLAFEGLDHGERQLAASGELVTVEALIVALGQHGEQRRVRVGVS